MTQSMLHSSNTTLIGKVLDAHGIKGEIYCIVFSGDNSWVSQIKKLTLNEENFDVLKIKPFKKGFIASLKGVENRNHAEDLKGQEVRVISSLFISKDGESLFLSELLNFEAEDLKRGVIGKIINFSTNGSQDLLVIENNDKSYEIPFVKEFVLKIDHVQKKIYLNLPEGLLEINEKE